MKNAQGRQNRRVLGSMLLWRIQMFRQAAELFDGQLFGSLIRVDVQGKCGGSAEDGADLFATFAKELMKEFGKSVRLMRQRFITKAQADDSRIDLGRGPEATGRESGDAIDLTHGLHENAKWAVVFATGRSIETVSDFALNQHNRQ